jgi:hypothetical protein
MYSNQPQVLRVLGEVQHLLPEVRVVDLWEALLREAALQLLPLDLLLQHLLLDLLLQHLLLDLLLLHLLLRRLLLLLQNLPHLFKLLQAIYLERVL